MIKNILFIPLFVVTGLIMIIILGINFCVSLFFTGDAPEPPKFVWKWMDWAVKGMDRIMGLK